MKVDGYLIVNSRGTVSFRKTKPRMEWDEISVKFNIDIPNELFKRPHIEARIKVDDVPNTVYNPEVIINTAELIAQQTGAKIDFRIIQEKEK